MLSLLFLVVFLGILYCILGNFKRGSRLGCKMGFHLWDSTEECFWGGWDEDELEAIEYHDICRVCRKEETWTEEFDD